MLFTNYTHLRDEDDQTVHLSSIWQTSGAVVISWLGDGWMNGWMEQEVMEGVGPKTEINQSPGNPTVCCHWRVETCIHVADWSGGRGRVIGVRMGDGTINCASVFGCALWFVRLDIYWSQSRTHFSHFVWATWVSLQNINIKQKMHLFIYICLHVIVKFKPNKENTNKFKEVLYWDLIVKFTTWMHL